MEQKHELTFVLSIIWQNRTETFCGDLLLLLIF
jgi:hypothetical protein